MPWQFQPVQAAAGMNLHVVMAPTNVSFYRVQVLEVGQPATNGIDYFSPPPLGNGAPAHTSTNGANQWIPLGNDNSWPADDKAVGGTYLQPWTTIYWSGGSFMWHIPFAWRVDYGPAHTNDYSGWDQKFSLTGGGTVTVRKFGWKATRAANATWSVLSKDQ